MTIKGERLVIIDADCLRYSCGFGCEKKEHWLGRYGPFKTKKEAMELQLGEEHTTPIAPFDRNSYLKSIDETYRCKVVPAPVAHCLHTVKQKINSILDACGSTNAQLILSGPTNFRKQLSPEYKANRKAPKPYHFDAITKYMIEHMGAELSDGEEADDLMLQRHLEIGRDNSIIATVDKDLSTCSGLRYNWMKPDLGVHYVSSLEAMRFFYIQLIEGDIADNIKGLRGDKKNKEMRLKGWKAQVNEYVDLEDRGEGHLGRANECLFDMINEMYIEKFNGGGAYRGGLNYARDHLALTGNLLWMRRQKGELWPMTKGLGRLDYIRGLLSNE